MNRNSVFAATALLPLFILMAGCAPMHDDRQSLSQQTPAANVDTTLPAALKNTVLLLAGVAVMVGVIGVGSAWAVTAWDFPGRKILSWALLLPLAMPT